MWVIGDSLVRRAGHSLCCRTQVHWHGIGGAGLTDIPKLLSVMEARAPDPKLIIVHVGTNDLLKVDSFAFRARIRVFMHECVLRFQSARIVWSDILPRACYFGTRFPARADRKRRSINRWCRSIGNKLASPLLRIRNFALINTTSTLTMVYIYPLLEIGFSAGTSGTAFSITWGVGNSAS